MASQGLRFGFMCSRASLTNTCSRSSFRRRTCWAVRLGALQGRIEQEDSGRAAAGEVGPRKERQRSAWLVEARARAARGQRRRGRGRLEAALETRLAGGATVGASGR